MVKTGKLQVFYLMYSLMLFGLKKNSETPNPRIYVADLSAYNQSKLHGCWIDVEPGMAVEDLRTAIGNMLKQNPVLSGVATEEWAIHEYEGFQGYELDEQETLDSIVKVAAFITEHGELGAKLINQVYYDVEAATVVMEEHYAGSGESLGSWAAEYIEENGELEQIPKQWRTYIDFERYAKDLDLGGEIFTIQVGEQIHVFWSR
jgi:antirestriction protein